MANDFDDDIVERYLHMDDNKTKTDALFDKINKSSVKRASKRTTAPKTEASVSYTKEEDEQVKSSVLALSIMEKLSSTESDIEELPVTEDASVLEDASVFEDVAEAPEILPEPNEYDITAELPNSIESHTQAIKKLKEQRMAKKIKKRKRIQAIALSIGTFIMVFVIGAVAIVYHYFGGLNVNNINEANLGVNEDLYSSIEQINPSLTKITNIALFGIDAREGDTESRSDAVMVMSINPIANKIKLISVMRDSYVYIDGIGNDKLTHAYYYGGPELTIKTLNTNFNLNITDYVTVDFGSMAQAIDALGGVYVDVEEEEVYYLNHNCREINKSYEDLTEYGHILLNGERAVGYARIRAIDGDQQRTGRQREVVMAAFDRVKEMSITELPGLAKTVIPMIETSLSYGEIVSYLPMMVNDLTMDQAMIPGTYDYPHDAMIDGVYYLEYDLETAAGHIFDFIYNDIHPETDPSTLETEDYTE